MEDAVAHRNRRVDRVVSRIERHDAVVGAIADETRSLIAEYVTYIGSGRGSPAACGKGKWVTLDVRTSMTDIEPEARLATTTPPLHPTGAADA
jgi:hypothetical protein